MGSNQVKTAVGGCLLCTISVLHLSIRFNRLWNFA